MLMFNIYAVKVRTKNIRQLSLSLFFLSFNRAFSYLTAVKDADFQICIHYILLTFTLLRYFFKHFLFL